MRRVLTEQADSNAIATFASNLRALLSQPPLTGYTVIGVDPGFRTGCKLAVVDPSGKLLDTATIFPHPPQHQREAAVQTLRTLIARHSATLVAIGNGTASRETEGLVAAMIREHPDVRYLLVSEAGASVYSASPLARAELPELDVTIRGAVSIARRMQDPLAELVKIDPQAIGVGLYQHDVGQSHPLSPSLEMLRRLAGGRRMAKRLYGIILPRIRADARANSTIAVWSKRYRPSPTSKDSRPTSYSTSAPRSSGCSAMLLERMMHCHICCGLVAHVPGSASRKCVYSCLLPACFVHCWSMQAIPTSIMGSIVIRYCLYDWSPLFQSGEAWYGYC